MPPDARNAAAPGTATEGDEQNACEGVGVETDSSTIADLIAGGTTCPIACSCRAHRCALGTVEGRELLQRLGLLDTDSREDRLLRWSADISAAVRRARSLRGDAS